MFVCFRFEVSLFFGLAVAVAAGDDLPLSPDWKCTLNFNKRF